MTAGTTIVAISRQKGSGGAHIGQVVAERRGMRFVDGGLLRDASEYLLVHDPNLEKVKERIGTWWDTMAGALAMGGMSGLGMLPVDTMQEAESARLERRIIEEMAGHHSAVIVGRGAGHVLKGRPGVLRVFVHAPEAWRIDRVAERSGVNQAKARDVVRESDRDRAGFMRALTGTDWTDARQYDLAIDAASTGLELAADIVLQLVPLAQATPPR
ncbi:MAG TPA: cytidylate kinase-like family protein [Vicinamibacterales bacterium]|nr:cytidylate kinase-like family protein [Vicinamibacterales bacterium]